MARHQSLTIRADKQLGLPKDKIRVHLTKQDGVIDVWVNDQLTLALYGEGQAHIVYAQGENRFDFNNVLSQTGGIKKL